MQTFNVLGAPQLPFGAPVQFRNNPTELSESSITHGAQESEQKRAVSFCADHQGCGFWRMHWAESLINANQIGNITNLSLMVLQKSFYTNIQSVRIQRQVTPPQLEFIKFLRQVSNETNGFKIYYEIDDVIYPEDIPLYNKARSAFVDPVIAKTATEIMQLCDGITAPTQFMADYYQNRTGVQGIVLPNYLPKFWIDRFYNKAKVAENMEKFKRKPRIGYIGSATHVNVDNVAGVVDDLSIIESLVRKTKGDFQWVFMGGVPNGLRDLIKSGEIEYYNWVHIFEYPYVVNSLNLNLTVAPLLNNNFNLAKAPIKYLEAGALGIPCLCQDLEPYKMAPLRFNTGAEMIDMAKKLFKDRTVYMNHSKSARSVAEKYWLEDHINEHAKLYFS